MADTLLLATLQFITFRWLDAIDIFLFSLLLYQVYNFAKGSVAVNIFIGILSVYLLWLFVKALNMQLLGNILGQFIGVGVIVLTIVFQQELRRFLLFIGTTGMLGNRFFSRELFGFNMGAEETQKTDYSAIVRACRVMAETKTGAIIILRGKSDLSFYIKSGDVLDARVSSALLESIFYKNNPLHDGAVIIEENTIRSARSVLPVTESSEFPSQLGMRHRAAVGITENTDATAIIVSEQTGEISLARAGKLKYGITSIELRSMLDNLGGG